eukprot:3294701-Pleurochrysis_carterae.AAC.7
MASQTRPRRRRQARTAVLATRLHEQHGQLLLRACPEQAGVALLIHEEVGVVHLLELELDWLDEGLRYVARRLLAQLHRLRPTRAPRLRSA